MNLGILVGGGPGTGINGVIAAAAREAIKCGLRVVGIYDGYRDLAAGTPVQTREIDDDDIARIRYSGGSLLRTSRTNPAKDAASLERCVAGIRALDLRYLVCIGGDDTTYGATKIAGAAGPSLGIATVPKTIDNDLPLPDNAPTFGFETARSVGTEIVESLIEDAMTTSRWYLVVSMGRKSGALALGMCKAAGATLAVIPEEFPSTRTLGSQSTRSLARSSNSAPSDAWTAWRSSLKVSPNGYRLKASRRSKASSGTRSGTCAWPTFRSVPFCATAFENAWPRSASTRPSLRKTSATNCAAPNRFRSISTTRERSGMARCAICSAAAAVRSSRCVAGASNPCGWKS